ncbi:MAG: hypothetical protein ACRDQU_18510 [Pseudonocardiaceae bacterium]
MLLVVGAAAVEVYVLTARNRDSAGTLVQTLVTVQTFAFTIAALLWKWGRPARTGRLTLKDAADQLAEQVRRLWEREAAARRLTSAPVPVRWRWSPQQITGTVTDVASGPGTLRFAPLPGIKPVKQRKLMSGALKDLLGVYGGLGSGRLVILGGPGSGKSGAAILLLLDALKHRASTGTPEEQAQVPVPVYFTAHGWDPNSERLTDWLSGRLLRNNDFLRAPEYGSDAAVRLIEGGYVAVILDGLDELPEELRPVALRALDTQATFRIVLLTRSEEMVAAVRKDHLQGAAAIELLPVGPKQAADYLASCQVQPLSRSWQDLITQLTKDSDSIVAQALDNPLMLTLVRDIYGHGDQVNELSDNRRFPSREAIEDHLLDQVLPTAYAHHPGQPVPQYTADQAQRWLGYLARCMNHDGNTRNLTWWQISRWAPEWPRSLAIVVVLDLVFGLAFGPIGGLTTMVLGLVAGLSYALMFGLGLAVMRTPRPPQQLGWSGSKENTARIRAALAAGLVIGLAFGFKNGLKDVPKHGLRYGLVDGTRYGLLIWFLVGLGFVLVTDLGARSPQQPVRSRWWSKTDLRATLAAGLAVKFIWGLILGITVWTLVGPRAGLTVGLASGFLAAFAFGFVVLLRRRYRQQSGLPQSDRSSTRITLIATIIGFVIALQFDFVLGFTFVVVVGLAGRPPRQSGQRRWNRTDRRTTLLVGLVAGLLVWLFVGLQVGLEVGRLKGLSIGAAAGLGFGLVLGALARLVQPSTEAANPLEPRSSWRRERQFGLTVGLGVGLAVGLLTVLVNELPNRGGLLTGLILGLIDFLVVGLGVWLVSSATWTATLACAQLWLRSGTPARLLRFLDDARDRQILRAIGPVYQFRHARLQDRLAEENPPSPAPNGIAGELEAN